MYFITNVVVAVGVVIVGIATTTVSAQPAVVPPSCTNEPLALETRDIPYLVPDASGFLAADVFSLEIRSTMVNNRSDAQIVLQDGADRCNYPSATSLWTKQFDGCQEVWRAAIPWSVLSTECGLVRTENTADGTIEYDGEIAVMQVEVLDSIRGTDVTRDLDTGMLYRITFPTEIELTSEAVTVFAPVDVLAAITYQDYNQTRGIGEIDLFTSVQWPFVLENPAAAPLDGSSSIGVSVRNVFDVSCGSDGQPPCERTFQLDLAPNGVCELDGQYVLTFDVACHPDYNDTDCPLQGENGRIEFTIDSEDLCGAFEENVDLTGQLRSFLSAAYTTERDAFIVDQQCFWRAEVASIKVQITDAQLLAVRTQFDGGAPVTLFDQAAGGVSAVGAAVNYAPDGDGGVATHERFHFDVDAAVFPVAADQSAPAVVSATVAVTYFNTAARKRVVRYVDGVPLIDISRQRNVPLKSQQQDTRAEMAVNGAGGVVDLGDSGSISAAGDSDDDGGDDKPTTFFTVSLIAVGVFAGICCAVLAGLVAVIATRRRRQSSNKSSSSSSSEPTRV